MSAADTSWILTATALVLLMTLPGLGLFYAGLVQAKNVLSVLMHCIAIACLMSLVWVGGGYTLALTAGNDWIGGFSRIFLLGLDRDSVASGLPEALVVSFQMTFAIITPALMVGAFVERIRFGAVMLICALWLILVYVPVVHWVWGGGWLAKMGVIDFAGGIVVHVTAGVSALVIAVMLGARSGFPEKVLPPHAPWMVMVGASLLWVGWFGFNAGSALAANGNAAMAMLVTHISASTASIVWLVIEKLKFGKPSLVGFVTGTIAGLATITPASGTVGPLGGFALGLLGGVVCYFAVDLIKNRWKIDDSLDVLAVHGVGGATGTLALVLFAAPAIGGTGFAEGQTLLGQFGVQILGVGVTALWSIIATIAIVLVTRRLIGLRVTPDEETQGLDYAHHGETAYRL
ncbi:ammonium transporter [Cucumibacter marinus]|uniref:ammonium transporter n=1 Tax=Cucumibacter marinus TaxID=1121252 RepID=UPI00042A0C41|nr:ammonium transporter [Cucumibacter marinus]